MSVYFCTVSGVRLVAPGVSREVDPVGGVDVYVEPTPETLPEGATPPPAEPEPAPAPPADTAPATPDAKTGKTKR